jgi:hypothetical protein
MNDSDETGVYIAMEMAMLLAGIGCSVLAMIGKFGPIF